MKKYLLLLMMAAFALIAFAEKKPAQVCALLDRIGGEGTSERIETRVKRSLSKDGKDVFEISTKRGKPYIQGNSLSALTTGIGWYLNHYAHINLAWNNLTTDMSKVAFPLPQQTERRECSADYRYYLNYCTYSYSIAFWTRERWEQEIDWMALHGINIPLALVGTDVVWKNVLDEAGYTREEIDRFVAGPGFQAWWLMNNLEGWGGPNPDWWYDRQERLCKFVLERMRDLGMEPVLPGYGSILPSNAREKLGVEAIDQGWWCSGFRRPLFQLPSDEKYKVRVGTREMCRAGKVARLLQPSVGRHAGRLLPGSLADVLPGSGRGQKHHICRMVQVGRELDTPEDHHQGSKGEPNRHSKRTLPEILLGIAR